MKIDIEKLSASEKTTLFTQLKNNVDWKAVKKEELVILITEIEAEQKELDAMLEGRVKELRDSLSKKKQKKLNLEKSVKVSAS